MSDNLAEIRSLVPEMGTIVPLDSRKLEQAFVHLNSLSKPVGSLGRLEETAARLAAMHEPPVVSPALMITVAGDHGVAQEHVSPFPQSVTREMVANFLNRGAGINALTHASGMDLEIVDAGCVGGPYAGTVIERPLGEGTANMADGPAMSHGTCLQGLANGIRLALDAYARGYRCLGIGEMGIANTTSASALYAHLLGFAPSAVVGPGTGATPAMIAHKAEIISRALAVNAGLLSQTLPDGSPNPVAALEAVGGFEIVTMAGIVLGAASRRIPVLVDGFISSSAYAAAWLLEPACADYAFVSHASAEPGHTPAMERLAARTAHPEWARPLLSLGFRLGEGTGAAVAYHLLKSAVAIYTEMATFDEVHVSEREVL